jgi:hypothetical protein
MFFSTKRVLSGIIVLLSAANYASAGTILPVSTIRSVGIAPDDGGIVHSHDVPPSIWISKRDNPPQIFGTFFDAALDDQAGLNDPNRPKFEVKALAQCLDLGPAAKKMSSARLNPGVSCLLYL